MYKIYKLILCICFLSSPLFSQSEDPNDVLKSIEQNNRQLKAYRLFVKSEVLQQKALNNFSDPEVKAYYLPITSNPTIPNYSEFEISQSFEFPTVYSARSKWISSKEEMLTNSYQELRQNILLQAKKLMIRLSFLNEQLKVEKDRYQQSKKIYDQTQVLFEKGQIGLLDVNKAKVSWMQHQFKISNIKTNIVTLKEQLTNLNDGNTFSEAINLASTLQEITSFNMLWTEKKQKDPSIKKLAAKELHSLQNIRLAKNKTLPNITLGYNNQGNVGNRVSGFLGGIRIPLWSNNHKIKSAKLKHQFQKASTLANIKQLKTNYFSLYTKYSSLLEKYTEYQKVVAQLQSNTLLLKAYLLGEYSYMQYYTEMEFYHKAKNETHQLALQLALLKATLLKHKL